MQSVHDEHPLCKNRILFNEALPYKREDKYAHLVLYILHVANMSTKASSQYEKLQQEQCHPRSSSERNIPARSSRRRPQGKTPRSEAIASVIGPITSVAK
uniref:Uncharacterized protein n=1 Tax=Salix viminalis TaxID=40686 RepID=A0A6N2NDV8_SALVM